MTAIDPPRERHCERCGRAEQFDDDSETWVGDPSNPGDPHCVHVWDITGTYNPVTGSQ
jgi:hypothetical protein